MGKCPWACAQDWAHSVPSNDPEVELNADVLRALQDCRAALSNATRLTKALQLDLQHAPPVLHALRDKCISWQERISMQIPWAANLARQSARGIAQGLHLHLVVTNDRLLAALRLFDEVGPTDWEPVQQYMADNASTLFAVEEQGSTAPMKIRKPLFGSLSLSHLIPKKRGRGLSTTSSSEQSVTTTKSNTETVSLFSSKDSLKSKSRPKPSPKFDPTSSFLQLN
ncbi:Kinase-like protein [Mycena indigotica]|uniref:Kinase-like protein n=1 Tax=Mycena indigotica TaxID=2126181 RepID=A0A8H6TG69_9AGAR|nr:Kinase-like protein [Mycena indigotica]KAF7316137.1 Kinase-like protein [Mycena indigotica]